ncbi:MAG: hypothetical protein AAFU55_17420, partial [Pseudomonadota bacterium]
GVAGAAATIALDFLIGDTVENFFEAITGTLDNSLFLEIGGQRVAGVTYTSGLDGVDPIDAAQDLLFNASVLSNIGVQARDGMKVSVTNDGGGEIKSFSISDFNPYRAQVEAFNGSGLGSLDVNQVANFGGARNSEGEAVSNRDVGQFVGTNSGLFLSEDGADFAFRAFNGTSVVNLTLPLNAVGTLDEPPTSGGTKLVFGSSSAGFGSASGSEVYFLGGSGFERMASAGGDDFLWGGGGGDKLIGNGGEDNLGGGSGDDELFGGSGDDELNGG